jgi:hypothetical protein
VTESLTTDLSRISGSFVIGRNTAFTYKGKHADLKQIGRELNRASGPWRRNRSSPVGCVKYSTSMASAARAPQQPPPRRQLHRAAARGSSAPAPCIRQALRQVSGRRVRGRGGGRRRRLPIQRTGRAAGECDRGLVRGALFHRRFVHFGDVIPVY